MGSSRKPDIDESKTLQSSRPISQSKGATADAPPASGAFQTLLERYDVKEKLGAGGMAAVFRAVDTTTGGVVALKIVEHTTDDASRHARFEREVRAAGRLVHPNVCRVLTFGRAPGKLFMAMELVEGPTLQRVIKHKGTLPVPIALEALRQLLSALECAIQAGVVHRDLKPANVMVTPDGTVKLLDFGIAKSQEDATVTATGLLIGTPAYMSPEQVLGGTVDGRSDLFSAGIILLVMLTGRVRFNGLEPAAVMMKVTTEPVGSLFEECPTAATDVDRFLSKLCAHSLEQRFQTPTEALAALSQLADVPAAESGPALLARYLRDADGVANELATAQSAREQQRAELLLARGDAALPAAALALHRASLLDPSEAVRRKFSDVCQRGNVTFDPPDDPKITEATASFERTPHAPGVVKRLADLHRARGNVLLAAAYLTRYLRIKPTDSHAQQQLSVLVDGPDASQSGSGARLHTRDIVAGIRTGGHVDPHMARPIASGAAMGPLTAAGLRPAPAPSAAPPQAQRAIAHSLNDATLALASRASAARKSTSLSSNGLAGPPVTLHTTAVMRGAPLGLHPLLLVVAAVVVAGIVLAVFSKFIKTTVDDVQLAVNDNEMRTGAIERNNMQRLWATYLADANAQLNRGSPQQAIRQVNLLLAASPPAELALQGLLIRARGRIAMKDNRSARVDLEQFLVESTISDPRRAEARAMLEKLYAHDGAADPMIAPAAP